DPERAELIRLQCRLAVRMAEGAIPRDDPDAKRAEELVHEYRVRWLADLPKVHGIDWSWRGSAGFWRGLPQVPGGSPVTLVRSAKRIGQVTPVESSIVNDLLPDNVAALAGSPVLGQLRVLEVGPNGGRAGPTLPALFASAHVGGLRGLCLWGLERG